MYGMGCIRADREREILRKTQTGKENPSDIYSSYGHLFFEFDHVSYSDRSTDPTSSNA